MKKIMITWLVWTAALSSAAWAADDLRDVKPPLEIPWGPWPWVLLAVVLITVIIILALRRLLPGQRARPVPPPPPAWETAYRRLDGLRAQNLPAQGKAEQYYTELSDIVRRYVESRFDIHAPEMTTEEFLLTLRSGAVLNARQKDTLKDFLTCCDMVKFARYGSSEHEMEESFTMARRFVDETRMDAVPPSAAAGGA